MEPDNVTKELMEGSPEPGPGLGGPEWELEGVCSHPARPGVLKQMSALLSPPFSLFKGAQSPFTSLQVTHSIPSPIFQIHSRVSQSKTFLLFLPRGFPALSSQILDRAQRGHTFSASWPYLGSIHVLVFDPSWPSSKSYLFPQEAFPYL